MNIILITIRLITNKTNINNNNIDENEIRQEDLLAIVLLQPVSVLRFWISETQAESYNIEYIYIYIYTKCV